MSVDTSGLEVLRRIATAITPGDESELTMRALTTSDGLQDVASSTLETTKSMAADFNSTSWDVQGKNRGALVAVWTGIDATNSSMVIEGSHDETSWNEIGGSGVTILSSADDSQAWAFTSFQFRYYRISYRANNVGAGTVDITGVAGW